MTSAVTRRTQQANVERDWRGPHPDYATALDRARLKTNSAQVPVSVWRIMTGEGDYEMSEYICVTGIEPKPRHADLITTLQPDPALAPFARWPLVEMQGMTDRALCEARADYWRDYARREAARFGITSGVVPYHVKIHRKTIKLYTRKVPLYTYIVRANPKFPYPTTTPPLPPQDTDS